MAEAVHFPGANFTFLAPEGREDVGDLHTFRQESGPANVSCWRLSPDELEEINRTGCVWLTVMSGRTFYPAFVGSETTCRSVVVDYGQVWKRETSNG